MKHYLLLSIFWVFAELTLAAQTFDIPAEDLDESELEQIDHFRRHPVRVNTASRQELLSCGLFSVKQISALIEYRKLSGDILSLTELSLIDAFTKEDASRLSQFLDFSQSYEEKGFHSDIIVRYSSTGGALKSESRVGGKIEASLNARIPVSLWEPDSGQGSGTTKSITSAHTKGNQNIPLSGSLSIRAGPHLEKIVFGDYCLRFGQGLGTWNGMTLTSLTSINSFMRRPTGMKESHALPPQGTDSPSFMRGAAANIVLGRVTLTPYVNVKVPAAAGAATKTTGGMVGAATKTTGGTSGKSTDIRLPHLQVGTGVHALYLTKSGEWGLTAGTGEKPLALEFRQYLKGFDFFGEWLPYIGSSSGKNATIGSSTGKTSSGGTHLKGIRDPGTWTLGSQWNLDYDTKIVLRARCLSVKEQSLAAGIKWNGALLTADAQNLPQKDGGQCKLFLDIPLTPFPCWSVHLRAKERLRSYGTIPSLTDLRLDNEITIAGKWKTTLRLETAFDNKDKTPGLLSYLEAGYVGERLTLWGRCTFWKVNSWEERIYVYERDAPQCFNVRAYYHSGIAGSLYVAIRTERFGKLYLRLSTQDSRIQCSIAF